MTAPHSRLSAVAAHLQLRPAAAAAGGLSAQALRPTPILASPTRGHVHPSVCLTRGGALVVVYGDGPGNGKTHLLCCRSEDGGASWSAPAEVAASRAVPADFAGVKGEV
jgi:hypothetical protein